VTIPAHNPTCKCARATFGGGFEAEYGFYFYWWRAGAGGRT
jgi:hypothetical protein